MTLTTNHDRLLGTFASYQNNIILLWLMIELSEYQIFGLQ